MKKNYLLYFLLLALSTPIWVSCNDWTESEAKDYFEGPSEEYYAALRAYKKSDHPKALRMVRQLDRRRRFISKQPWQESRIAWMSFPSGGIGRILQKRKRRISSSVKK